MNSIFLTIVLISEEKFYIIGFYWKTNPLCIVGRQNEKS